MPAPRIEYPFENGKTHSRNREDLEDLLQRAAALLGAPVKSPLPSPPISRREPSAVRPRKAAAS